MPAPTTDAVIRIKALRNIAGLFTSKTIEQEVFNLVFKNLYSNMWILIDPGVFCHKIPDITPKRQVTDIIEKLGYKRLATVFRTRNDDFTSSLYLVRFNPRMISKISRRKKNLYIMSWTGKVAQNASGDIVIIDDDKVSEEWRVKLPKVRIPNGDVGTEWKVDMKNIEWERIL